MGVWTWPPWVPPWPGNKQETAMQINRIFKVPSKSASTPFPCPFPFPFPAPFPQFLDLSEYITFPSVVVHEVGPPRKAFSKSYVLSRPQSLLGSPETPTHQEKCDGTYLSAFPCPETDEKLPHHDFRHLGSKPKPSEAKERIDKNQGVSDICLSVSFKRTGICVAAV